MENMEIGKKVNREEEFYGVERNDEELKELARKARANKERFLQELNGSRREHLKIVDIKGNPEIDRLKEELEGRIDDMRIAYQMAFGFTAEILNETMEDLREEES